MEVFNYLLESVDETKMAKVEPKTLNFLVVQK